MKNKNILIILIFMVTTLLLTSCYDYSEIEKEVFLFSIGFDKNEENYEVTAETLNSSDYGGSLNIKPETITSTGESIYEALENLNNKFSNKLNLSHLELIIIGDKLLKENGLSNILNLVFSNNKLRYNTLFCTTFKTQAKEILMSKSGHETFHGFEILEQLNESGKFKNNIRAYKILNNLYDSKKEIVLPVIKVSKENEKKNFFTNKLAILEKGKLKGYIEQKDSKYYFMLIGEKDSINFPISHNNKKINLKIKMTETKSNIKNNVLNINMGFDIYIEDSHLKNLNKEQIKEETKRELEKDLYNFISNIQKDYKIDIFGFGNNLINYKERKKYKNWNKYFSSLNKKIKINIYLKDKLED